MKRGSGSTWRKRIASKRSVPRASASFEWFPPTVRCASTENVSSNTGAGNPWPQTSARRTCASSSVELSGCEAAVRIERPGEIGGRQLLPGDRLEHRGEARQIGLGEREAGGERVAAELREQARGALGREVERVAQVEAGDRAPRALELAAGAAGEHDGRTMVAVLEPPGDDADDALMPIGVEEAERVRIRLGAVDGAGFERGQRLFLHRRLDVAALAVQPVELGGERHRRRLGVGEQAADAERHVGETAGGVEAGAGHETQVVTRRPPRIATRGGQQRLDARVARDPRGCARAPARPASG